TIVEGHPSRVRGINVIGLKRAGLDDRTVRALKNAYRALYRSDRPMSDALGQLALDFADVAEVMELVNFLRASGGGRQGRQGEDPGRRHA
ncbi:MAG: acyl-[acyl-carrier-protein]--UDP-N-acetylglucosamine O-acyltransferase, partial [Planctomycetota bacterium]|nr:acyl-[acyl-carrier-protein]--UDP-N-acetylglucosamine O-acyltransferase [Planctomycetota bacterium]